MIKSLENPHFKKIWEEVNWKTRHPKAKSLEEALEAELLQKGCVAYNTQLGNTMTTIKNNGGTGNYYNQVDILVQRGFDYNDIIRKNNYKPIDIIVLGRPINLEDIMVLLRGKNTALDDFVDHYHIDFAIWKKGDTEFDCVKEWCFRVEPYNQNYYNMGAGFFWQLTKHLHEQTPETWEKISKLINK